MNFEYEVKGHKTKTNALYLYALVAIPYVIRFSIYILGVQKFSLRFKIFVFGIEISWGWENK